MHREDLETKVIKRFVVKTKQERFLNFVRNEKLRQKFIRELYNMNFLELELFEKVEKNEYEFIKQRVAFLKNVNDCYIISDNYRIDKKTIDIQTALNEAIGADSGILLVFGDAEIIYAEAEGFNNRWISKQIKFQ
jgi:hypothetical protein